MPLLARETRDGRTRNFHEKYRKNTPRPLQFPNAVVLNAVGRRNTQIRAKERKWAQKSANARAQKGAKERKRALLRKNYKQPGLKQPGLVGTPDGRKFWTPRKNPNTPNNARFGYFGGIFGVFLGVPEWLRAIFRHLGSSSRQAGAFLTLAGGGLGLRSGEKKPININNFSGLFWEWVGSKLFMCCLLPGERGKHINQYPRKSQ